MKKNFFSVLSVGLIFSLASCYYDKEDLLYGSADCNLSLPKGPLFTRVDSLITNRCGGGGCHINGDRAGGYNFDADCSIVTHWNHINEECQSDGMPLPPQSPFSASEKAILTNWINAGHRYDN